MFLKAVQCVHILLHGTTHGSAYKFWKVINRDKDKVQPRDSDTKFLHIIRKCKL
jgi:hypothetical protein